MASGVALVGLGPRGREWARAIHAHPAFDLVAGVDPDPRAREAARPELAVAAADLGSVLARDDVQAVLVATPPEHHADACRAALERGLAVLVEKPFTLDLAAATELADLAEERATPLLVAQTFRHLRFHRASREVVRDGRLGTLRHVSCRHYRSEPDPSIAAGNPTLWDLGVHHLDAMRDLVGEDPAAVLATSFDAGSSLQVLLEFPSGVNASYFATRRSRGHERFEGGKEHYLRVSGERGTLHVLQRWLVLCESGRLPRLLRRGRRHQSEEASVLDDLAGAMRGHSPGGLSARENIGTLAILDACARSALDRRWVTPTATAHV